MKYINLTNKNIKIFLSAIVFCFIAVGAVNLPDFFSSVDKSRELYKKAKEYQDNSEFKLAYNTYSKISRTYRAYNIVLFQQAKCAAALGDEKTVINKLEMIVSNYHESLLEAQSSYNLGQAFIRTHEYRKAENQFLDLINKYPDTDFALGSYYYLGQINKQKNKDIAVKYWLKYINSAPDGRFALDCINGIISLKKNPDLFEKKTIAKALFTIHQYNKAQKYLVMLPIKDSWYYLAKIATNTGNKKTALYFLKEGIKKYPNNINKTQMQDAMLVYTGLNPESAINNWTELISMTKNAKDFALFHKAQLIPENYAMPLYKAIVDYYPDSYYASASLWNLFWNEFNKGNYNQAIKLGKKHAETFLNTKASPKILFWTAKAFERTDQKLDAKDYYKKVLSLYPDSYYAFRADGRLKAIESGNDPGWLTSNSSSINDYSLKNSMLYSYNEICKKNGVEVAELIFIGDYDTAASFINNDLFLDSWMKLHEGLITRSTVLARDGMAKLIHKPDSSDKRWTLVYPVFFAKEINCYTKIYNLDPVLILSLIKEESHFNPLAVSSSNALGLMQLLPGTARDVSRWNNIGAVNKFQLFDPKTNIKFGMAYFKYTRNKLYNNSLFAVAAYNGGPGAVEKWLKTIPHDDMDEFIENIPYDQTRDYIKKVYGSYWNYKRIYNI